MYWLKTAAHKLFYLSAILRYASKVSVEVFSLLQVDLAALQLTTQHVYNLSELDIAGFVPCFLCDHVVTPVYLLHDHVTIMCMCA